MDNSNRNRRSTRTRDPCSSLTQRLGVWYDWDTCNRCPLHEGRNHAISQMWGYVKGGRITDIFTPHPQYINNLKTILGIQKLVLICGEAPGKQEDIRSMIFIGKSGNLLRRQICEAGHDFIFCLTNTVCCRPPNNRAPTKEEKKECKTHLDHILESYPFDLSVLVGKHAENVRTRTETIFIKHPAWILRQDYPLIPYMETVDELRRGLSSIKITV